MTDCHRQINKWLREKHPATSMICGMLQKVQNTYLNDIGITIINYTRKLLVQR